MKEQIKKDLENAVLSTIRSAGSISQKDLFEKKLAGEKAIRTHLNSLFSRGLIDKEAANNGAITWKSVPEKEKEKHSILDNVIEETDHNDAEKAVATAHEENAGEFAKMELVTAFKVAGMTESRAVLMAEKVLKGDVTEQQVLEQWERNPGNPTFNKKVGKGEFADKLRAADNKAKEEKQQKRQAAKKTSSVSTNYWGHREGSQASLIDDAVKEVLDDGNKDIVIGVIAEKTGLNNGRISLHLQHLIKKKGIELNVVKTSAVAK